MSEKIILEDIDLEIGPIEDFYQETYKLADWQKDIIRRILEKGKYAVLSEDLEDIVLIVKEKYNIPLPEGKTSTTLKCFTIEDLPCDLSPTDDIILEKIYEIDNINALHADGIVLNENKDRKLTIIYGRNGSGKSGYSRIIKNISAFRDVEKHPILKNIFKNSSTPPKCKIRFSNTEVCWSSENTESPLPRKIRVFDSKNANIYINEDSNKGTEVVYSPFCFSLLESLSDVMKKVSDKLSSEKLDIIERLKAIEVQLTDQDIRNLKIDKTISNEKIETITHWDTEKEEELEKLKNIFETPIKRIQTIDPIIQLMNKSKEHITEAEYLLSSEYICNLYSSLKNKKQHEEAIKKLKEDTSQNNPLKGVCSSEWELLWKQAIEFNNKNNTETKFPETSSICPLCMNVLDKNAKERLLKFESFIKNKLKSELDDIYNIIKLNQDKIEKLKTHFETSDFSFLEAISPQFREIVVNTIQDVLLNIKIFKDTDLDNFSKDKFNNLKIKDDYIAKITELNNEKSRLEKNEYTQEEKDKFESLKQNKKCHENKEQIKRLKRFDELSNKIATAVDGCNTRQATNIRKALDKKHVTNKFSELIKEECELLDVPYDINISFSSCASKTIQKLSSKTIEDVHKIMSEGERKVCALACFIAEFLMSGAKIPVVLDDPINSLDHNYISRVAKRIILLAKDTQVIVFTHNLLFLRELEQLSKENNVQLNSLCITKLEQTAGILANDNWDGFEASKKLTVLKDKLNGTKEEEKEKLRDIGGKIRQVWEETIEDILFDQVVTRFKKQIETSRLIRVIIEEGFYDIINKGISKTSSWADHSKAAADESVPSKSEISEQLKMLEDFQKDVRKKQGDLETKRKATKKDGILPAKVI